MQDTSARELPSERIEVPPEPAVPAQPEPSKKEEIEDIIKEKTKAKKETEKEVDDEAISFGR